ncbi:phage head spike fiber domain-containing protein [Escherichia coli]|uniref:phage head spike fiber domain-containing protein n=1 Tax=Escherichia coli TaxID=562 RepID=UPI000A59AA13
MQSLQHKRSGVAGKKPTPEQLQVGELAINLVDHVIYTKDKSNAVVQISVSPESHNTLNKKVDTNKTNTDKVIAANKKEAADNLAAAKTELTNTINTKDAAINKRADGINTAVLNLQKTVAANKTDADNKITSLTSTITANNTAINKKVDANKAQTDSEITRLDGRIDDAVFRGELPTDANLDTYGPRPEFVGVWGKSTSTNATDEYNFPEDGAVGILEVFSAGNFAATQRYTTRYGNIFVRNLSAKWNGSNGPWSPWRNIQMGTRPLSTSIDLNDFGGVEHFGLWRNGSTSIASLDRNFPEAGADGRGLLEVFEGGSYSRMQRYTTINGRVYIRTLAASWDASAPRWEAWKKVGLFTPSEIGTYNKAEIDKKISDLDNALVSKPIQPLPDVWIPFNDSLDMITGFSPSYKKIVIGEDEITMPSDKTVKFKRASTATYINKSGVFSVAGIDEPRFEKDGLLIEGQRTNYFVKSNTPAEWTSTSNIDKSNNGVDEFGFSYAKMKTKENMTGQSSALSLHTCSASRGVDVSGDDKYCTVSCRVKAPDGLRCRLRFEKYDGSAYTFLGDAYLTFGNTLTIKKTGGAANRITANATKDPVTGWIFYEATIEAVEGESLIGAMIQYAPKEGGTTEAGDYIYLATPQFENGGCASSFVVTTTAPATRASDMVTIPTENNIYSKPLTCLVEVNRNWGDIPPNVAPRIFDFSGVPPIESITYAFNTTEKYYGQLYMQTYKESTSTYVSSVFTGRTDVRKFVGGFNVYSNGTKRVVTNGEATGTMKTEWTGVKTRTFIRIGGQATSGTRHLFGHLRNLRLWHKELTDAQMRESVE